MYVRMYVCIYVIVLLMYVNACFVCNVFCVWYVFLYAMYVNVRSCLLMFAGVC